MTAEKILQAALKLQNFIESENYGGYDPYDALKSPLFSLPVFRTNKWIRFAAQQAVKRSPVNLRRLLAIPKGVNPVTLGLCIQAYTNLDLLNAGHKLSEGRIGFLMDELAKLIPDGFEGACWGYDFDWEARYARIPAYQPTVVATGIVTNALFQYYAVSGNQKAFDLCQSACNFILKNLNRTEDGEKDICFSYSPFDKQCVFNASMKAVRTLSQVYSVTRDENLRVHAQRAVRFVMKHQQDSGAWGYSLAHKGGWIDNYHTGYILDCLDEYIRHTGDQRVAQNLQRGLEFYQNNFFESDGIPKFYHAEMFPVDCTAAAQSILTLCRFHQTSKALLTASWMIEHMQDEKGYFYFRKFKNRMDKTSLMRWSNAWMFAALSALLVRLNRET